MITVSADSPAEVLKGKSKHGLEALMLSDRDLRATDTLGLRNTGATSAPRPVPVPTSIIVDASGVVRWLDQSEHYTRRSDRTMVFAALREHLGTVKKGAG